MSIFESTFNALRARNYPLVYSNTGRVQVSSTQHHMFYVIPVELQLKILGQCPLSDLKKVMSLSKRMLQLGKLTLQHPAFNRVFCSDPEIFYQGMEKEVRILNMNVWHSSPLSILMTKFTCLEELTFSEGAPNSDLNFQDIPARSVQDPECINSGDLTSKPNSPLRFLKAQTGLQSLDLGNSCLIDDRDLQHLKELTNLKSLNVVTSTSISLNGIDQALPSIESIKMAYCWKIGINNPLTLLTNLKTLELFSCSLEHNDVALVGSITSLANLTIRNSWLQDESLTCLEGLTNLQTLGIQSWKITAEGMTSLGRLAKLKKINLKGCQVTDRGVGALIGLTKLSNINFSHSHITDEGLSYLTSLQNLQHLNLRNNQRITNKGVKQLTALKKLQTLNVVMCDKVDARIVKHFMKLENIVFFESPKIRDASPNN